jgi:hypothetical protein
MKAYIVRRHRLDWASHAARFKETGGYDPAAFLPDPAPPGFPDQMRACIDLWNAELAVDFFACRAALAEVSRRSCMAVRGAELVERSALPEVVAAMRGDPRSVCLFVDDDDWYAPHLVEALPWSLAYTDAVRWSDLLFNGRLLYRSVQRHFPRLAFKLRDLRSQDPLRYARLPQPLLWGGQYGLPVKAIDWLFQTNSYALTGRFLRRGHDLAEVIDHVHASGYFKGRRLGIRSLPRQVLSATNKHPCSATHLAMAVSGEDPRRALRAWVEGFVADGRAQEVPGELAWLRPLVEETLALFEAALAQDG